MTIVQRFQSSNATGFNQFLILDHPKLKIEIFVTKRVSPILKINRVTLVTFSLGFTPTFKAYPVKVVQLRKPVRLKGILNQTSPLNGEKR